MSLKQIQAFCAIGETLHFGKAAARLNLSQPPLSRQIASLERELGVTLCNRTARGVTLTPAGTRYLADARLILALIAQAKTHAVAVARGEEGSLRIGFTSCAAYSVVPAYARSYAKVFPSVMLSIRELLQGELTRGLLEGDIDAAIMFPPEPHPRINTRRIYSEPICAVLPADHQLTTASAIDVADLAAEAFVTTPRSAAPSFYDAIMNLCDNAGFEPRVRLEAHLQQTIVNLVAEGVGVALVPQSMRQARLSGVVFKAIVDAPLVHLVLAWNKHGSNPCLKGFLDLPIEV